MPSAKLPDNLRTSPGGGWFADFTPHSPALRSRLPGPPLFPNPALSADGRRPDGCGKECEPILSGLFETLCRGGAEPLRRFLRKRLQAPSDHAELLPKWIGRKSHLGPACAWLDARAGGSSSLSLRHAAPRPCVTDPGCPGRGPRHRLDDKEREARGLPAPKCRVCVQCGQLTMASASSMAVWPSSTAPSP